MLISLALNFGRAVWVDFWSNRPNGQLSVNKTNRSIRWMVIYPVDSVMIPFEQPGPRARFSKAPETAIFRKSVSKNGEVYTLETSCMKGTSLHL